MNARYLPVTMPLVLLFLCLTSVSSFSQSGIQMKLQLMPGGGEWGVYAKPVGWEPSNLTITGSGQIGIIMPVDFTWGNQQDFAGNWMNYSSIIEPEGMEGQKIAFFAYGNNPALPIQFQTENETLLFSFSSAECPDTLYLLNCAPFPTEDNPDVCPLCFEHPDNPCPEDFFNDICMSNPRNELSVLDLGSFQNYNYVGNYALSAWSCHDCDGDGIPNGLDDPEECVSREKVKVKLQYNSFLEEWDIRITPNEDFTPTDMSELLDGRLTIVGTSDFWPGEVTSFAGGEWQLGTHLTDVPQTPDLNYFTFEMQADGQNFNLENGEEITLFRIENSLGECPESLHIMDGFRPTGIEENELRGISMEGAEEVDFELGDIHGLNAWVCELIISGGGFGLDSLSNGGGGSSYLIENKKVNWFTLAPNPTSDYLQIKVSTKNTDNQSFVRLISLHGQTLQMAETTGQNSLHFDLTNIPTGLYFLLYEEGGKVLHREKLIKK